MIDFEKRAVACLACLALVLAGCSAQADLIGTATPVQFQRGISVTESTDDYFATQQAADLEIVEVSDVTASELKAGVANPSQTLTAYNWCTEQSCRILVEELGTHQIYELAGPFLSWRPISDPLWLNDDILAFDQWSNPHYGIHYEVDFGQRKIIFVSEIAVP